MSKYVAECSKCRFYVPDVKFPEDGGNCKRFPKYIAKSPNNWCGEFAAPIPKDTQLEEVVYMGNGK